MKSTYNSVEDIYRDIDQLIKYARTKLHNNDFAVDCVHEALRDAVQYLNNNKERKVNTFMVFRHIDKAIKRYNRWHGLETIFLNEGTLDASDSSRKRGRRISNSSSDLSE